MVEGVGVERDPICLGPVAPVELLFGAQDHRLGGGGVKGNLFDREVWRGHEVDRRRSTPLLPQAGVLASVV